MTRRRLALSVLLAALLGGGAVPARAADPAGPEDDAGVVFLDVRDGPRAEAVAADRTEDGRPAGMDRAGRALLRAQGPMATLETDPTTGTVRSLADLGGTLTGVSDDGPARTARDYVRGHLAALGLDAGDLATLRLDSVETTSDGVTHVRWVQQVDGVPAFDNGLRVDLDRGGRILAVGGSPLHDADLNTTDPRLDADDALRVLGGRAEGDTAELVLFDVNGRQRLAWRVRHRASPVADLDAVVDAVSGRVLRRANSVKFAVNVKVFPHYPGASVGGAQLTTDIEPVLFPGATTLAGPNARAWSDVNDNDAIDTGETVNPNTTDGTFDTTWATNPAGGCSASALCSWNASLTGSWHNNRAQNAIQAFWFVNRYARHLARTPIGFDKDHDGFFCATVPACDGANDDRVQVHTDDGAATDGDMPDDDHVNNANMSTPPDGDAPVMQMYLFYKGSGSPFRDINGGDTAEIVYHEYTHGLSNRLVTDSGGHGALDSAQAGAMGEAWSDWYAMDFLARADPENANLVYVPDTPGTNGEVDLGAYTDSPRYQIRSQALDCPVGAPAPACPGLGPGDRGGYTYGDFGKIAGGPEVHADGEIWGETLWDLRTRLIAEQGSTDAGSDLAEQLVTGAMRLSPPEPSFLDMRNAILQEAAALNLSQPLKDLIWDVFTTRGMGFFAATSSASDTSPAESFDPRPCTGCPTSTLSGTVSDASTGRPIAGVTISVGGPASGTTVFSAQSGADGQYVLPGLPDGTYQRIYVSGASGYDSRTLQQVVVGGGQTTLNVGLVRNWAAAAAGGTISAFNDGTGTIHGCGPEALINGTQTVGWSPYNPASTVYPAATPDNHLDGRPPTAMIALPRPVDVSGFGADPGATCGDDESATTKQFTIETSADGQTFTTAVDGSASGAFLSSDAGRLVPLTPLAGSTSAVRFVRLTLLSPQDATCPSSSRCSGKDFIDFSELTVYGNGLPTGSLAVPSSATAGRAVTLDASSFSDDGAIASYVWDFEGDGTTDATTTTAQTTHVYPAAGSFTPRVVVTDTAGGTGSASAPLTVATAPPVVVTTPPVTPVKPKVGLPKQSANRASIRITCQTACTVTASIRVTKKVARRLKLRNRVVGTVKRQLAAGTATVRVPVTKTALRKLRAKRIRRVALALSVRARDTSGLVTTAARTAHVPISKR